MKEGTKNALRSGVVVIGALAFGYLTLQLCFKPFLEKAQLYTDENANLHNHKSHDDPSPLQAHIFPDEGFSNPDS